MSLESLAFRCSSCNGVEELLLERCMRDVPRACPSCGGESRRMLWANITRASYIDGTSRWGGIKEARKLEREMRKLKQKKAALANSKDYGHIHAESARIEDEMGRVRKEKKLAISKGKKLVETAPKISNPE